MSETNMAFVPSYPLDLLKWGKSNQYNWLYLNINAFCRKNAYQKLASGGGYQLAHHLAGGDTDFKGDFRFGFVLVFLQIQKPILV